jgi:hypothetical protein
MYRFIEDKLVAWKVAPRRKPLILRGARQVGKTWSLKHFGQAHFDEVVIVDLERNPDWHRVFDPNLQPRRICAELEILTDRKIVSGRTLLLLDEIQACPRAVMALRYFYEEMPELHVAAAGSLLEFILKDISFPVGRVQFLDLFPLSFAEFLKACGKEEAALIVASPPAAVSETVHEFLGDRLREYFFVGGMPESVLAYQATGSLKEAFEVQAEICNAYRADFSKYRPRVDPACLNAVLSSVARSVGRQIQYAKLADGYSNPTIKKAFDLLCQAGVIVRVPAADPTGLPLGASASARIFKALMVDIGLMRFLSGMPTDVEYGKADLLQIHRGAMAEQFVGQELRGKQNGGLHYWSRRAKSSSAEVDFLAVHAGKIFPVEVKSGAAGSLRSLHLCLETHPNCPRGIVYSARPYGELPEQRLLFLPLYLAGADPLARQAG